MEMFLLGALAGFCIGLGWGTYKAHLDAEYLAKKKDVSDSLKGE